jgi:hypothetical protein
LIDFDLILPLHKSGIPRLRLDYFFGHYHKDSLSNHTYGIRGFSLGSEVGLPNGPIRPYANAGYEWISFFAGSYLLDEEKQRISESVDGGSGWFFCGGSRIPVDSAGRWAIDIGLRYHHGGTASYLAEGGIQINPDESLTITPTRGKMQFLIFMLGFQFKP